jgi:hypothetical protein
MTSARTGKNRRHEREGERVKKKPPKKKAISFLFNGVCHPRELCASISALKY